MLMIRIPYSHPIDSRSTHAVPPATVKTFVLVHFIHSSIHDLPPLLATNSTHHQHHQEQSRYHIFCPNLGRKESSSSKNFESLPPRPSTHLSDKSANPQNSLTPSYLRLRPLKVLRETCSRAQKPTSSTSEDERAQPTTKEPITSEMLPRRQHHTRTRLPPSRPVRLPGMMVEGDSATAMTGQFLSLEP